MQRTLDAYHHPSKGGARTLDTLISLLGAVHVYRDRFYNRAAHLHTFGPYSPRTARVHTSFCSPGVHLRSLWLLDTGINSLVLSLITLGLKFKLQLHCTISYLIASFCASCSIIEVWRVVAKEW